MDNKNKVWNINESEAAQCPFSGGAMKKTAE